MKKTNIILGLVIAVFIICAICVMAVAFINNKEDDTIPVNVDFSTLSENIEENTDFDTTKMEQITAEDLETDFNISSEWITKLIGQRPYVNVSASMYVIVKANEENVDDVLAAFEAYGESYEELWKDYLTEEYELVKNRKIGAKGTYVYFIVSDYAEDIISFIKD